MVYEFEELYIVGFIQMFIWWKKSLLFEFNLIIYFHFMIYDLLIMRKKEMLIYVLEKNIPIRVDSHVYVQ